VASAELGTGQILRGRRGSAYRDFFRELRDRLELLFLERLELRFLERLVSPASLRCLFTVRAAISSARGLPRASSESLMCSYCRFRFGLFTPRGGIGFLLGTLPSTTSGAKTAPVNTG
jgi:hypothetical protein